MSSDSFAFYSVASAFSYAMPNDFDFILMKGVTAVVVDEIELHDSQHFMFCALASKKVNLFLIKKEKCNKNRNDHNINNSSDYLICVSIICSLEVLI